MVSNHINRGSLVVARATATERRPLVEERSNIAVVSRQLGALQWREQHVQDNMEFPSRNSGKNSKCDNWL